MAAALDRAFFRAYACSWNASGGTEFRCDLSPFAPNQIFPACYNNPNEMTASSERTILKLGYRFLAGRQVSQAGRLHIPRLHDHYSAFLDLPTLMLSARYFLNCVAMLVEAREMPTRSSRATIDIVESLMGDQDCDERGTMQHREAYTAHGVPRWVSDR